MNVATNRIFYVLSMACALAIGNAQQSQDQSIFDTGFDLFNTPEGHSFVDLTPAAIPGLADPIVQLVGEPLGPANTDTIVERLTDPFTDTTGLGDTGTVDIELIALSLRSVDPVDISGTLFDIDVISGALLGEPTNPTGSMTITHNHPNGGTFTAVLPVQAKLTFTEVGNPGNNFFQPFNDEFLSNGVWSLARARAM